MDKTETRNFIVELLKLYPAYFYSQNPSSAIDIWQEVFADIEYEFAHKALLSHAREADKNPTVNELYKRAYQIKRDDFFAKGGRI